MRRIAERICAAKGTVADSSKGVDPAACSLQGMAADQLTSV